MPYPFRYDFMANAVDEATAMTNDREAVERYGKQGNFYTYSWMLIFSIINTGFSCCFNNWFSFVFNTINSYILVDNHRLFVIFNNIKFHTFR